MIALVTGAAGFIGSALSRRLLDAGHQVIGVDCLTKAYDVELKMHHLNGLVDLPRFQLLYADLTSQPLHNIVGGVDVVFHLAGQASVTRSWGDSFADYTRNNIDATQRLLEACVDTEVPRVVYASSSSVYGNALVLPTPETALPRPISPYGVSKLAGEHLCHTYNQERDLSVVSLRLFTVYGPGQRPDMCFHKLFRAAVRGERFVVNGDGSATRDFTYVDDVVDAMVAAAASGWNGVANVGGAHRVSLREVLDQVHRIVGPIDVTYGSTVAGDARDTSADVMLARAAFGYQPAVPLNVGLEAMADWARELFDTEPSWA